MCSGTVATTEKALGNKHCRGVTGSLSLVCVCVALSLKSVVGAYECHVKQLLLLLMEELCIIVCIWIVYFLFYNTKLGCSLRLLLVQ